MVWRRGPEWCNGKGAVGLRRYTKYNIFVFFPNINFVEFWKLKNILRPYQICNHAIVLHYNILHI